MLIPILIVVGFVLLIIISGGYVFWTACARRKEHPWFVEEELKKTSYGKYYQLIVASDLWLKEHYAQDVYITSDDGLKLHGHWIPVEDANGTIILAHGYRSTKLVDFGAVFDLYHSLGMNILVPDQRCHGLSEGKFITFGVKESGDMRNWIDFHNRELGSWQIILSGLSMGASTMIYLADEDLPKNVKGIIADCGFTSPKEIISSVFTNVTHLPPLPTIWAADLFARMFAGFRLSQKDSRISLSNSRIPVMMVHGKKDGFVPCKMTEEGFASCTGPKHLLLVDGADHGLSYIVDRQHYTQMVLDFLNTNIDGFH